MPSRILVVDDERLTRETLSETLRDEGFEVLSAGTAYEGLELLEAQDVDLVLTDLRMPSMDGLEFHNRIRETWPDAPVVFMTAFGTVDSAVKAMREGAADYLTKPLNTDELLIRVRRLIQRRREIEEIRRLRIEAGDRRRFGEMIYRSKAMASVVERALAVADIDATLLIRGETGTGKELLARAIHSESSRSSGPLVAVNCAGLNPHLVESELFGHEPGAFTGAVRRRKGRLEIAEGGTLFIDEVDDLGPDLQVRLLRFLEDRSFERVGSSQTLRADVRVVCASKRNLSVLVAEGSFREDLYYRINTVEITLPPLRDRTEDIAPLAELFLRRKCEGSGAGPTTATFTPEVLRALLDHDWPGNVRELQHAMEHAAAFARCGEVALNHLPDFLREPTSPPVVQLRLGNQDQISMTEVLQRCERDLIDWALDRAGGNQGRAAEILSVPRTTFRSRLAALNSAERDDRTA